MDVHNDHNNLYVQHNHIVDIENLYKQNPFNYQNKYIFNIFKKSNFYQRISQQIEQNVGVLNTFETNL